MMFLQKSSTVNIEAFKKMNFTYHIPYEEYGGSWAAEKLLATKH
jgi:hypothetical protein